LPAPLELNNALLINPYDVESVADTLKQAIEMSAEERTDRMARLQEHVSEHNIFKWLAAIFTELDRIRGERHSELASFEIESPQSDATGPLHS
jgi:trehalose-6-phosphate synthase